MPVSSLASPDVPLSGRAARRLWKRRAAMSGAVLVGALVVAWGFRDDALSPIAPEPVPPLIAEKTRQIVRKNGQRLWQFDAEKIELSPDGSQTYAHGVSNGILFRDDKPFLHLSAPQVHLENASNNLDASGGVQASGDNRFAIASRLVSWNYEQKKLFCPSPVKAQLRDFSFDAPHLSYQWDAGDLTCNAPIELRTEGVRLSARTLKASTKTRVLELGGGIHFSFDSKTAQPNQWKDLLASP